MPKGSGRPTKRGTITASGGKAGKASPIQVKDNKGKTRPGGIVKTKGGDTTWYSKRSSPEDVGRMAKGIIAEKKASNSRRAAKNPSKK